MTIRLPDSSMGDRILEFFGKKRGFILPENIHEKYGHTVYARAVKENFWKALLRPKNKRLPENVIDYETIKKGYDR